MELHTRMVVFPFLPHGSSTYFIIVFNCLLFFLQLGALLDERFFNSCLVHQEDRKNEENSFCMDCCFSLCMHCMPYHQSHRILQIRRYMYKDVLRLKDAHKIFDCSLIQVSYPDRSSTFVKTDFNLQFIVKKTYIPESKFDTHLFQFMVGELYYSLLAHHVIFVDNLQLSNESAYSCGERVHAYGSRGVGKTKSFLASVESSVEENSSNGFTRKSHGRKCVPQRSPLF
ncbi:hypothetical protein LXL04_026572 [Taraxacum kok-saghyz]